MENNVRKFRKEAGLTMEGLADLCDTGKSYIYDLEVGKYSPSITRAYAVSKALNKDVTEVFPDSQEYEEVVSAPKFAIKARAKKNEA